MLLTFVNLEVLDAHISKLFQSATALLVSAVHDDDAVVRQTATKVLEKHPKIKNVTREQENIVLRYDCFSLFSSCLFRS